MKWSKENIEKIKKMLEEELKDYKHPINVLDRRGKKKLYELCKLSWEMGHKGIPLSKI